MPVPYALQPVFPSAFLAARLLDSVGRLECLAALGALSSGLTARLVPHVCLLDPPEPAALLAADLCLFQWRLELLPAMDAWPQYIA